MEYCKIGGRTKSQWHHKKAVFYQMRMRRRPTRAERRFDDILDEALKGFAFPGYKPIQRKFKKQRIFEDQQHKKAYIVDFYIPKIKLAIEIDGPSHNGQKNYDDIRTSFLNTRGISVIRIMNDETLNKQRLIDKLINIINKYIVKANDKRNLEKNPEFYEYLYGYIPKWATYKIARI